MAIKDMVHDIIADKAYEMLRRRELSQFTMTELAKACEISKPTLYRHFKDKFEVVQYICDRFSDEFYGRHTMLDALSDKRSESSFFIFQHPEFFKNVLSYSGQNNIFDYLSELERKAWLKESCAILGTTEISEDLRASIEYYAYSNWHAMYAMLVGKIPKRFSTTSKPVMALFWPPMLVELLETQRKRLMDSEGTKR